MTKKILFVCRGNSARSQLAEAIVNRDYADQYQPLALVAIQVMSTIEP